MLLFLAPIAVGADLAAYLPAGAPFPGDETEVVVEWPQGEASTVVPVLSGGELVGAPTLDERGRTRLRWIAPQRAGVAKLLIGRSTAELRVRARPSPSLVAQEARDAVAWTESVEFTFLSVDPPSPDQVVVATSEGQVREVSIVPGGITITVAPGPERVARVLAVGVLDLRTPGQVPVYATVRLRAHHGGQVNAEPGSRLSIRIGGRGYGPWVADSTGTTPVSFDALPGETSYELTVADDLGNTQKVINAVPTIARPAFVGLSRATFDRRGAWLAGWDARGQPFAGEPPTCRLGGAREPARALTRGQWTWSSPPETSQEQVAVCALSEATATIRVASVASTPAQLALRVYPETVSVDFPLAEVQAWLLDEQGQRLQPDGIELAAAAGQLTPVPALDAIRADYNGTQAAPTGGDDIRAIWRRPSGNGPAARLELCVGGDVGPNGESGPRTAVVRVLDANRRPLPEHPVEFAVRSLSVGQTRSFAGLSDGRGYARFPVEEPAMHLVASSGAAAGELLSTQLADVSADCLARADAQGADLISKFRLPIAAGRVRQVSIETEPRTLRLDPGATARVRVRLIDGAGGVVRDERVELTSSEGALSTQVIEADGSITALFTPDASALGRSVAITATAGDNSVATTLDLVPREVHGGVSVAVGYLTSLGTVASPTGVLAVEQRLPLPGLAVRMGVSAYGFAIGLDDDLSGETIQIRGIFFPIEAGATYTQRGPRWSLGAGIGLVLVPYGLSATYEAGRTAGGPGLSAPGVVARGGLGYRFGQAEAFLEAGYLLYTLPDSLVGISGNAGGLTGALGYRLLY